MRNFFSAMQILFMIFVQCHQTIFFQISRLLNLFSSAQNNQPKQTNKQTNPKTDKLIVAGDKLETLLQSLLMWGTLLVCTQTLALKIKSSCQIYQEICPCHEASCLTSFHSLTVKDFIINLPHLILHKITRLNDISLNSNLALMLFLKKIQSKL